MALEMDQYPQNYLNDRDEKSIGLMEYATILAEQKKRILRNALIMAVVLVAWVLLRPNVYTAKTSLLPPQHTSSSASIMLSQLGSLAGMGGGGIGTKSSSQLYVSMLRSKTIADELIAKFRLQEVLKIKNPSKLRTVLERMTKVAAEKDGVINIMVTYKDPVLASKLANAYVEDLNRLSQTLAITTASQKRIFFENQLNQTRDKLSQAEYDLQQMQGTTGMIQVYPQEKEIAESNARLRAEIAAKEVELSSMRIGVTQSNPQYLRVQNELSSLKGRLKGMESSDGFSNRQTKESLEYIRKFREVKFEQAVLELMFKQFEAAKIDEAKDFPLIQVLDKAEVPDEKSGPFRSYIVMFGEIFGVFCNVLLIFFKVRMNRYLLNQDNQVRYQRFLSALKWKSA